LQSVAEALANGEEVEAKRHANVSILFADIEGFTEMSSVVPPTQLMHMLDDLYGRFDALCKKHDVYKVETIGDVCEWRRPDRSWSTDEAVTSGAGFFDPYFCDSSFFHLAQILLSPV
jgi:class 3 adenylate cyclase